MVLKHPSDRCYRRDNWQSLLASDDPKDPVRYYNAPWECRHRIACESCGKVLEEWPSWHLCPCLSASPEGRELCDAWRAPPEARDDQPSRWLQL
jgi:hypothetical protein